MQIKNLVRYSFFTVLICVFSCITVPVGYVPVTLSIPAILISSAITGVKGCIFPVMTYIFIGLLGIPVFSGFGAGIGVLLGPTGGYICSYILMAVMFAVPVKIENRSIKYILRFCLDFVALLVCYFWGSMQYAFVSGMHIKEVMVICVYPFVLIDIIKLIVSRYLSDVIYRRLMLGNLI